MKHTEQNSEEARKTIKEVIKTQDASPHHAANKLNSAPPEIVAALLELKDIRKISPRVLQNLGTNKSGFIKNLLSIVKNPKNPLSNKENQATYNLTKTIKMANPLDSNIRRICREIFEKTKARQSEPEMAV